MKLISTLSGGILSATVTLLILIGLLLVVGCGSAPVMEKPITLWSGAPEVSGICKTSLSDLKSLPGVDRVPDSILKRAVTNRDGKMECMRCDDPRFALFSAKTWDDEGTEARYIATLINQCAKWK